MEGGGFIVQLLDTFCVAFGERERERENESQE